MLLSFCIHIANIISTNAPSFPSILPPLYCIPNKGVKHFLEKNSVIFICLFDLGYRLEEGLLQKSPCHMFPHTHCKHHQHQCTIIPFDPPTTILYTSQRGEIFFGDPFSDLHGLAYVCLIQGSGLKSHMFPQCWVFILRNFFNLRNTHIIHLYLIFEKLIQQTLNLASSLPVRNRKKSTLKNKKNKCRFRNHFDPLCIHF